MTHTHLTRAGTIVMKARLSGRRQLQVKLRPQEGRVVVSSWARIGDEGVFHLYPAPPGGDCLGGDFLSREEHAILTSGLQELVDCCARRELSEELIRDALDCLKDVLGCVAKPVRLEAEL